jgi:hypothetical protein
MYRKEKDWMEQQTFIPAEYTEIKLIPKAIVDNDPKKLKEKAEQFKKKHRVIEVKQRCPNVIILFYVDEEDRKANG